MSYKVFVKHTSLFILSSLLIFEAMRGYHLFLSLLFLMLSFYVYVCVKTKALQTCSPREIFDISELFFDCNTDICCEIVTGNMCNICNMCIIYMCVCVSGYWSLLVFPLCAVCVCVCLCVCVCVCPCVRVSVCPCLCLCLRACVCDLSNQSNRETHVTCLKPSVNLTI